MSTSHRPIGDDVLVRRAARGVGLQTAGLVALAMLLLIVLVTLVVVREQDRTADNLVRSTAQTAEDVDDPPPGSWIVIVRADQVSSTPGLPSRLVPDLARLRSQPSAQPRLTELTGEHGRHYRVATQERDGRTVQAVLDLTSVYQERDRLFRVMGAASALGLLFAVLLGVLLGRRAVRPLAQALALQRSFVADASHELRTPLTLLSTRAQVLDRAIRSSDLSAQVRADSQGVVQDVQLLGEVVEDLLLAADPRGEETHEPTDMSHLVEALVDSARAHAADTNVTLTWRVDGDAPHWVLGSAPALRRAVLALVDNAIDHTPPGGTVSVAIRRERRTVVLSVSDTGPGIAPGAAQNVLRRFDTGGHRAGRAHYGLGLALTHDVANRHGGQLRLVDGEIGATFELVLPVLRESAPRKA